MSAWLVRLSLVVATGALLCAGTARAQQKEAPKPADNKALAKEHYTRGTSFYDLGRYDEAIKEFEAAYQLKNDPAFLYNLAQSYRQAGNHERALHFYKTYLRYVPKAPNRADIEERIKTLEQQVAQQGTGTAPPPVTTTPPPPTTPPPGTEPTVVVPPGSTTPPPPGSTPPGEPPPGYTPPASGYVPPTTSTTTDPGRKFRIAGLASAGTGALLYVLGLYQWNRASSASSDIEAAARNGLAFDPAMQERGQSAETAQWWCFGLGTIALAGGAGLWFYGHRLSQTSETTTWRIVLAPTVAPNQGGATLRIVF
jgi:tetratricopeptide (TPR) repeat protein